MKIHLLLLLLFSIASCMKQNKDSKESIVSSHSSVKQIQAEIEAINSKMNNNPQYRLTQDEYETLIASGHFSDSEKVELKQLFQ